MAFFVPKSRTTDRLKADECPCLAVRPSGFRFKAYGSLPVNADKRRWRRGASPTVVKCRLSFYITYGCVDRIMILKADKTMQQPNV